MGTEVLAGRRDSRGRSVRRWILELELELELDVLHKIRHENGPTEVPDGSR